MDRSLHASRPPFYALHKAMSDRSFHLYGLSVAFSHQTESSSGRDVTWHKVRSAALPPGAGLEVRAGADGGTDHIFARSGVTYSIFSISSDGCEVVSLSLPDVLEADLFALFAEPVMRTVLVRRGFASFHASALAKDGQALLVMGAKGAGKSTFSLALQRKGWTLLADDLVRVREDNGRWSVPPGYRVSKLHDESLRALGYTPEGMPYRWLRAPPGGLLDEDKKRLLPALSEAGEADVPIKAVLVLRSRESGVAAMRLESLSAVEQVWGLLQHATPDPLDATARHPPATYRAIEGLAHQASIQAVTLPDSLDRLLEAAEALSVELAAR